MPRNDTRAVSGYRHEIRPITEAETERLVELRHAIVAAHAAADDYVVELYESHVSQGSIAEVLGITQGAVHQRIIRRLAWRKTRRESGDEPLWFNPHALQPRTRRS